MRKQTSANVAATHRPALTDSTTTVKEFVFHLPPGTRLSDVYIDGQQVSLELNISKRTLREYRRTGKLSHTSLFGKIFYFRQEIAALLAAGASGKAKLMNA